MSNLVTEARVELYSVGSWGSLGKPVAIPKAVEAGRMYRRLEIEQSVYPDAAPACPVRVIDSAGVVVQQWGKP